MIRYTGEDYKSLINGASWYLDVASVTAQEFFPDNKYLSCINALYTNLNICWVTGKVCTLHVTTQWSTND